MEMHVRLVVHGLEGPLQPTTKNLRFGLGIHETAHVRAAFHQPDLLAPDLEGLYHAVDILHHRAVEAHAPSVLLRRIEIAELALQPEGEILAVAAGVYIEKVPIVAYQPFYLRSP